MSKVRLVMAEDGGLPTLVVGDDVTTFEEFNQEVGKLPYSGQAYLAPPDHPVVKAYVERIGRMCAALDPRSSREMVH